MTSRQVEAEFRKALEPFARLTPPEHWGEQDGINVHSSGWITKADITAAREALSRHPEPPMGGDGDDPVYALACAIAQGHVTDDKATYGTLRDDICKPLREAADTITRLRAELAERDNWKRTASAYANDAAFYQGVVRQIGEMFGDAAKTSDDGTLQQDVLALKVPELVADLKAAGTFADGIEAAAKACDESAAAALRLYDATSPEDAPRTWVSRSSWLNTSRALAAEIRALSPAKAAGTFAEGAEAARVAVNSALLKHGGPSAQHQVMLCFEAIRSLSPHSEADGR